MNRLFVNNFLVAGISVLSTVVHAQSFSFVQTGFADGAEIIGTFSGFDANNNGVISGAEISAAQMTFSGNSLVAAFSLNSTDRLDITYWTGTSQIKYRGSSGASGPATFTWDSDDDGSLSTYFYSRVFGRFGLDSEYIDNRGVGAISTVSVVPEVGSALMLALGLACTGIFARSRRV
jgi:hypothetical protein